MTVIKLENVTKSYGKQVALDSININIPEGKVVGILGPNGAGKSTLFKTLVGLVKPTSGKITILGNSPTWKNNTHIAYLPDRGRWYPNHTVEQALEYAIKVYPNFNFKKADQLIRFMGLNYETKVSTLSKGQEARLLLVLCLARDVRIVLLDEPFSGIDLVSREKIIQGIIQSLTERNQTILISTHEIHETESLFDQVVFLNEGRVVLTGDVETLRQEKGSIENIYRGLFQ